ncbi:hypothetical protein PSET11_01311 [Arthrobacter ulcerisalmonis]|uniref:Uncharacterized protein n=1 Tax=Arthrobacter ulcerisalmonis TaxID=2483813 RepID=A0A3P5X6F9_9MICC|nr:hypothetical protein [Arthrobacter ulcerisalmonis]VDC23869.1 hypothetical protein PSET11_01311 [Arthrobacter ulcerisalmonis]
MWFRSARQDRFPVAVIIAILLSGGVVAGSLASCAPDEQAGTAGEGFVSALATPRSTGTTPGGSGTAVHTPGSSAEAEISTSDELAPRILLPATATPASSGAKGAAGAPAATMAPGASGAAGAPRPQGSFVPGTPDAGCVANWPTRLLTAPQSDGERQYLAQIVVCASQSSVRISNLSAMVWDFFHPAKVTVSRVMPVPENVALFHDLVLERKLVVTAFMAPGETVTVPLAAAEKLSWLVDPVLSLSWKGGLLLDKGVGLAAKAGSKYLLTRGSPGRKAGWDCTEAIFKLAATGTAQEAAWDAEAKLKEALGVTYSAGKCATSWQSARRSAQELPALADVHSATGQLKALTADAGLVKQVTRAFKVVLCGVKHTFC